MTDGFIKKIFENSDKAELMEWIEEHLSDAHRALVLVESRVDGEDGSHFCWYPYGFNQLYELSGFIRFMAFSIEDEAENEATS